MGPSGTDQGAAVSAQGLTKTFGDLVAVDHIDFSVARQECFGFLGPNGAGKTTTVRMVHCFTRPTSGLLEVLGHDASRDPRAIKAKIGVCPQENNLDPDLTVWDNLRVFARYFDIPKAEALAACEELLHFVGLSVKKGASIDELSGGMKRRLMIARSLVNRPSLLVLDEPTLGLDPQARHQIWESVNKLKNSGTTVLLTTHYMDEAAHLCDRIVVMDTGRIVAAGRPKDLIRERVGSSVLEIASAESGVEPYLRQRGLNYEKTSSHFYVYTHDGEREFADFSRRFGPERCVLRMANLEDVFLKLTGRDLRD